jgi:uncharacterized protein YprB with RNaseH-like and TPR domain
VEEWIVNAHITVNCNAEQGKRKYGLSLDRSTLKIILMNQDLQNRLRRLGVTRGARDLKTERRFTRTDAPLSKLDPGHGDDDRVKSLELLFPSGRLEDTAAGACFVLDHVYPITFQHGNESLAALLQYSPAEAALFCGNDRLAQLAFRDFLFLDTETTGLGGAGTLAFMVGVGFVEQSSMTDVLVVRQYFLRDHGDETAMLLLLDDLLSQKVGLVTFNGRSFDLPLLDNRYLMNRLPVQLLDMPHIDLLPPSRRLWRNRFGSVALGNLEQKLLGVQRTGEDVPGWLIPGLYNDYLRSGDARELRRVFYHNELDMLSMVTLTAKILRQFTAAQGDDHPLDLFSLGKWQLTLGLEEEAELNYRRAAAADLPLDYYHRSLQQLGLLLKRDGRRQEAVPIWQQWAATSMKDVDAHVELAKHYEWHERDLQTAVLWTERALTLLGSWTPQQTTLIRPQLEHRLTRLRRKLGRSE